MRRGFTLLEVLLATALASALVIAAAGWIETTAQARRLGATTLTWEATAEATLRLIHDDVVSGDFTITPARRSSTSAPPRVVVDGEDLSVSTRVVGVGVATKSYRHDAIRGLLLIRDEATDRDGEVPLLDRVESWSCELDSEGAILSVSLTCTDGRVVTRRIPLS